MPRAHPETPQALFDANVRLAYAVAHKMHPKLFAAFPHVTIDDAIQVCLLGVWCAAEQFSPDNGTKFSTLATTCAIREMQRLITYETRQKFIFPLALTYLDSKIPGSEFLTFGEVLPGAEDTERDAIAAADLEIALNAVGETTAAIARMRIAGYQHQECGEAFGISHTMAQNHVKKFGQALKGGA